MSMILNATGQAAFFFIQDTEASTWLIPHGLNKRVVIDVLVNYKGQLTKISPQKIIFNDANTVTVLFSKPMTGRAMIS